MDDKYKTRSTSKVTANVEDRLISQSEDGLTRKVIRATLIDNPKDPDACVKITLIHQRRSGHEEWVDIPAEPFTKLKGGETARFPLDSFETHRLSIELQNLQAIFKGKGIPSGNRKLVVGFESEMLKVPSDRAAVIKALIDANYDKEVWAQLSKQHPDLATQFSYSRLQQERIHALNEFEDSLSKNLPEDDYWQPFFERNTWIFGYGLNYKFLTTIQSQPHYGGTSVSGRGDQRGDYLTATAAQMRFTVLVEIKRPDTGLVVNYRDDVYAASKELAGGVSQLQVNCRKWEVEGSRLEQNDRLKQMNVFTVRPKGILVIGHTSQLADDQKRFGFELFRRGVTNPEILTFDELYQRAKHIVEHGTPSSK